MNKITKIIAVVVVIVVVALLITKKNTPTGTLNVGEISAVTGPVAYIGQSNMRGTEIGKLKAEQEHPGLTINLYHEDSQFAPTAGVNAYNKLRQTNNINALITMASNISVAIAPLALKDNVLDIAASTLANSYTTPKDLTFRLTAKGDLEAQPAVDYLVSKGYKKLGIIYMQNEIGVSLRDSLKKAVVDKPIAIVAEEGYSPDTKDFRTILLKMKSSGVDSIYLASVAAQTAQILPQARDLDINVQYVSYRAYEDTAILPLGKLAESVVYTNVYDSSAITPENLEFKKMYQEKYNEEPNGYAAESYEAFRLIADAFVKCGNTVSDSKAKDCTVSYLTSIKNRSTVMGPLTFDENGDVVYTFFMKTFKDGKFIRVQ